MNRSELTKNEKKVLHGIVCYPFLNDSTLSKNTGVKLSTFTSIKRRLLDQNIYRPLTVPMLSRLGCELLAVIYTQFNPLIPLEDRVKTTKKTIEVFDEIVFSTGEQEKGFSISLSENYTTIGRINEIRTETFSKLGLLEKEYPNEVIFPFETSSIIRFFDFRRILGSNFQLQGCEDKNESTWFPNSTLFDLTDKEKKVYGLLVEHPNATATQIGDMIGLSRHTISRMKKKFFKHNLLRNIIIPDMRKIGFEILAFYHIQFNPGKAPDPEDINYLDTPSTIFLARRKFEMVLISAYPTYQDYKIDKMEKIRYLKENDFISYTPLVRKYEFDRIVFIKNFDFSAIAQKILKS